MKPWYASKTLWANLIAFAAAVAAGFGLDLGLDAETQGSLVVGIMAVVNIVLRLMTKTAIGTETPADLPPPPQ